MIIIVILAAKTGQGAKKRRVMTRWLPSCLNFP